MTAFAFYNSVIRRPAAMGAMAPTSATLSRRLAAVVPDDRVATVVELGPGTGPVSAAIHERLAPGSRHIGIEIDPDLVPSLRTSHPWMEVIHGDAADLIALLEGAGAQPADAVVSTLPWSLFPPRVQERILAEIGRSLSPGGVFTTVVGLHALIMSPGARALRGRLAESFDEAAMTRTIWANVPPSRTYVCRKPTRHRAAGPP